MTTVSRRARRGMGGVATVLWLAAALLALGPSSAAEAVPPSATGWWSRAQVGLLGAELPPPPGADEADLVVGSAPDGATAIAALRYQLSPSEGRPILTLIAKSEANGENARLAACPAVRPWTPAVAGRWDERPTADCQRGSIQGIRVTTDDGAVSWTFPLEPLLPPNKTLDVVFVPGTLDGQPQGAANGSSFQLIFAEPGPDALAVTTSPPPAEPPPPAAPRRTVITSPPAPERAPFTPALPNQPDPVPSPADGGEGGEPPSGDGREQPRTRPLQPIGSENETRGRWQAAVVLVLAATAATLLARPDWARALGLGMLVRAPAAPAPDEPVVRGLGRFARPRTGLPPPL